MGLAARGAGAARASLRARKGRARRKGCPGGFRESASRLLLLLCHSAYLFGGGELRGFQSPPPPTPTQPVPGDFRVSEFHLPLISRGCLFVFAEIEVKSAHRTVPSTWWELKK